MKTTAFNRQNLKEIRVSINNALRAVAEEFDIVLDIGNISFDMDGSKFTTRLTAQPRSAVPRTIHQGPIGMGTTFRVRGSNFTIIKVHDNRPKFKFVAQNQNGTRYKFSEELIRQYLGM